MRRLETKGVKKKKKEKKREMDVTRNTGEAERFFNHTNLSSTMVRNGGSGVGIVVAMMHMVSPYILPHTRRLVVQLCYSLLQLSMNRTCRRRRHWHRHSPATTFQHPILPLQASHPRFTRENSRPEFQRGYVARAVQYAHYLGSFC